LAVVCFTATVYLFISGH